MKNLTEGNIYKTFLLFAVPLILAGFLSQAYNIIDTVIAGRILSEGGLAAIGSTSAFIQFFSSFFWGYGNGLAIYIARLFGAGDYKRLKKAIYVNVSVFCVIIAVLSLAAVLSRGMIFNLLKVDEAIRKDAAVYFSIYMLGEVFLLMNFWGVYIMNSLGSTSYPLFMSVLSTVLHIGGNLFAVLVLDLGVGGIAASTVLSAVIVDICYFIRIKKYFKILGVDKYKVSFAKNELKRAAVYSCPTMLQQSVMYLSSLMVSPMVNGIGSAASAAYVVCLRIYDINATLYQNSSKTVSTYIAQSIGAEKYENVKRGLRVGFLQGLVFMLPVLIFCTANSKLCCSIFLSAESVDSLKLSAVFVKYFMPFIVFNMVNNLFHSFFRGVASLKNLVISTFIGSVTRIAATYVAVGAWAMNGVYAGWAISWIVEFVFCVSIYLGGFWKNEEIRAYERKRKN